MKKILAISTFALITTAFPVFSQPTTTITSFNIRYGTANDGENHWSKRKGILFNYLASADSDLIGTQEGLAFQFDEVRAKFPQYAMIGVGRDDAKQGGEYAAILYRKDRFSVLDSGTFWFSSTPEKPSADFGNSIRRICSWGFFENKSTKQKFYLYNIHLDHISQVSREKSIELLLEKIKGHSYPIVITGDLNAGEENKAVLDVKAAGYVDSFRVLYPNAQSVGTFNAWVGKMEGGKIDYVFTSQGTDVKAASIDRYNEDGRYPSDHCPVTATVVFAQP